MAFSYFGYKFVYLAAEDTGLGGGVEDIVFLLYRVCHIEGVSSLILQGKFLIGIGGGLALSHLDSKATIFMWGCSGFKPDLVASL